MAAVKHSFSGMRIAYPRISAGLAGGDWNRIAGIIDGALEGEHHARPRRQGREGHGQGRPPPCRGGVSETPAKTGSKSRAAAEDAIIEVPTVGLGKLKAGDYDKPREPLPALHFSFDAPVIHGAVLR